MNGTTTWPRYYVEGGLVFFVFDASTCTFSDLFLHTPSLPNPDLQIPGTTA